MYGFFCILVDSHTFYWHQTSCQRITHCTLRCAKLSEPKKNWRRKRNKYFNSNRNKFVNWSESELTADPENNRKISHTNKFIVNSNFDIIDDVHKMLNRGESQNWTEFKRRFSLDSQIHMNGFVCMQTTFEIAKILSTDAKWFTVYVNFSISISSITTTTPSTSAAGSCACEYYCDHLILACVFDWNWEQAKYHMRF